MVIEPDVVPEEHPNFERQVQHVSIGQTDVDFDTMTVTITDADSKIFVMRYQIPGTPHLFPTHPIIANGEPIQFRDAI